MVGESEGVVPFHVYPDSGLSTASDEVRDRHAASGVALKRSELPMRTLSSICEEHAAGEIHFLKIDVEGLEGAVLRGMDFKRWRPWLVVIETPFDQEPEWKSVLPGAGYRKVRFDGLNTFYLAEEHFNLAGAFDAPPNYMDDFQLRRGHPMCHPLDEFETRISLESERADRAEARLAEIEGGRWFRLGQRLQPLRRLQGG